MKAVRSANQRMLRHVSGAALVMGLCLALAPQDASADVEDSEKHRVSLAKGSYKIRLAAALTLSRDLSDANISALTSALLNDRDVSVRRIAVVAVAKACATAGVSERVQVAACRALRAAEHDTDGKVKKVAQSAAAKAASTKPTANTGLYVYIPMTHKTTEHAQLVAAIGSSLAESSSQFAVDWSSTSPQQADIARKARRAYRVDVAAARIDVKKAPRGIISLQCSVSVAVAPWSGAGKEERWTESDTARITGSARVESGGTRAEAATECVRALGRDMVQKRLAVFLRSNAPQGPTKTQVAKR